jgi:hypothetical protein
MGVNAELEPVSKVAGALAEIVAPRTAEETVALVAGSWSASDPAADPIAGRS